MTYHVVDSLEKIEDLRGIWNRYHDQQKNASFMNDIEYYKIQMAAHPDENSPFLLVGEEEESITTLVIGFLRSVKFAPKIGYIKLPLFRKSKRCLYIIPNGFLGLLDEETGKAVVSNLVRCYEDRENRLHTCKLRASRLQYSLNDQGQDELAMPRTF